MALLRLPVRADNYLHILLNITPHILHRDVGTLIAADGGKKQVMPQPTQECRQCSDIVGGLCSSAFFSSLEEASCAPSGGHNGLMSILKHP